MKFLNEKGSFLLASLVCCDCLTGEAKGYFFWGDAVNVVLIPVMREEICCVSPKNPFWELIRSSAE